MTCLKEFAPTADLVTGLPLVDLAGNLSIHKRAAVLALRNVATTVMDCVDVAAVASSDREMLEADRYLSAVVDDQVGKLEVLEKILAAPS